MTKREQEAIFKKIINAAKDLQAVCEQNLSLAARLESEAKSAMVLLGAKPGQTRKGKYEMTAEEKVTLLARLTKTNKRKEV